MEPKKKSSLDYIIPAVVAIFALYLALMLSNSYDRVNEIHTQSIQERMAAGEQLSRRDQNYPFVQMIQDFSASMKEKPFGMKFTKSTPKFLIVTIFALVIAGAYIFTTKKNYITGKEFGTSRWGVGSDIAHLQAGNILKKELQSCKGGPEEKEKLKMKYAETSNTIFTKTEKICMYNRELNNNVMIVGGSGSGKTRGYVLPNILQCCNSPYSPSIVVTDPKGEILQKVGKYLEENGYEIKVFDLKEQRRSFCFNPFHYILETKYEEQIANMVASIMASRDEKNKQGNMDPFWDQMAQVLLKAIFYATYEGFPEEEQNLPTVMELFRWFEVSDNDDRYKAPTKLDRFFDIFGDMNGTYDVALSILEFYQIYDERCKPKTGKESRLCLDEKTLREEIAIPLGSSDSRSIDQYYDEIKEFLKLSEEAGVSSAELKNAANTAIEAIWEYKEAREERYDGYAKPIGVTLFEKYGDVNTNPALRNWEDFRTKCKGKTAQGVTATALAKLSPFDEEQIRRIFSKDEMELELIGERKTALFIVLPPTNMNYNFMANVLYTLLFEQLEYCATVKHNQTLPVPVKFILDEFYNTGKIPQFENILSYARSFGIGITIILQSLDQIKEMYEKSWGTVVDNCSAFLYLGGIRHEDTLKYISNMIGKGTFDKKTYSQSKGRQSSTSINHDKIGRELMDPSEVQRMDKSKCLLFISGYQPFYSDKYNYTTHPKYKYTWDADKDNIYDYANRNASETKNEVDLQLSNQAEPLHDELNVSEKKTTISSISPREDIVPSLDFEQNEKDFEERCLSLDLVGERSSLLLDDDLDELLNSLLGDDDLDLDDDDFDLEDDDSDLEDDDSDLEDEDSDLEDEDSDLDDEDSDFEEDDDLTYSIDKDDLDAEE